MGAWDGTAGFHNKREQPESDGFWPVGEVAFRATSAELHTSAVALRDEVEYADEERAAVLLNVAEWYDDLALDLAEIRALPEDATHERV